MTFTQFKGLLDKNKLDLKDDSNIIFELFCILSELEYNSFISKNPQQDAAQNLDDVDISSDHQKEAA
ncbi:MAG: hypothetical protein O2810_07200 [Bacteroidetes bacterium]|nr:hypothetical protein [Bacteroidota bacterium]MDA1085294.1 hypothetical protein [Bacteroidota bacterium]